MDGLSLQEALEKTTTPMRDRFAMVALGCLITQPLQYFPPDVKRLDICRAAYQWADAMLKAREEK